MSCGSIAFDSIRILHIFIHILLQQNNFTFRHNNQDGLENLFGGVNSCNHVSKSIPTHFKTGYATMLVNNLNSGTSLSSNCEPDFSKPLVNNVHELLLEYIEISERENQNEIQESVSNPLELTDFNSNELVLFGLQEFKGCNTDELISFEPEFASMELSFVEEESISLLCGTVCRKLIEKTDCSHCINLLETPAPDMTNELSNSDQFSYKTPSSAFIKCFKSVYYFHTQIIPDLCSEKSLKSKIVNQLVKDIEEIGCSEHKKELTTKMKYISADYAIKDFCNSINNLLSGKVTELPLSSNHMQSLALDFRNKGKHNGKYKEKENLLDELEDLKQQDEVSEIILNVKQHDVVSGKLKNVKRKKFKLLS